MRRFPVRKNIRLKHYDYRQDGYYFVTICCADFQPHLAKHKEVAEEILKGLPKRFSGLKIDYFVLMPNHIHVIFVFQNVGVGFIRPEYAGLMNQAPTIKNVETGGVNESSPHKKPVSLGEVVRSYKALVKKEIGIKNFWQRNYYEHVIRNAAALLKIREYIQNNPDAAKIKFEEFYR